MLAFAALFACGVGASLLDWNRHPPAIGPDGHLLNRRNGPGDLTGVVVLYAIEFALVALALQPWNQRPRSSVLAVAALVFAAWGILRWLIGLHSPTVMFSHDVLILVVALALGLSAIVFSFAARTNAPLKPVP
jgi:hypothetical protein